MKKRRLSVYAILVLLALTATAVLPAFANEVDQKRSELSEVRRQKEQQLRELNESKKVEQNELRQLQLVENELKTIEAQIRSLEKKIENTENQIAETEKELRAAEARIAEMEDLLAIRLRAIYEQGNVSYLEVLFDSATFTEFLSRYNDLQLIIAQDRELLSNYEAEREVALALKEELEANRQELEELKRDHLAKKDAEEKKKKEHERLLVAARSKIDAIEEQIKKLEAEEKNLEAEIKRLSSANLQYMGTGVYTWPVPEYGPSWITSGYGYRTHPITKAPQTFHGGIDIGIPHSRWPGSKSYSGRPVSVVAADDGIANVYPMSTGYGNLVIIDHGGNIFTVYAHLHRIDVKDKQRVTRGEHIAIVGSTGYSTGPHLHFEVRVNGERKNPLDYVR